MSEWSKEPGLGPGMFACVGSNPAVNIIYYKINVPMAQWSRRLSTEQEILGSSPSRDSQDSAERVGLNFFSSQLLMGFKPLLSFRGTTIARAFLLNAILIGITTALTIEVRRTVNENRYTKDFPDVPHKVLATAFASTLIGLTAYIFLRILFGSGGGMLAPIKPYPHLF